jgi:hypothetical protein
MCPNVSEIYYLEFRYIIKYIYEHAQKLIKLILLWAVLDVVIK